ncbi:MAG: efflux RND transporter periplasmic adaptor subunit [Nannocystis sp.]|nr:efflux RND transporter periplasmic adaptor subunit [Nannocystis sp.]MBA3547643.1 efflux RND transporter periplasmic adaptor subunit [Nannocystis sp.]
MKIRGLLTSLLTLSLLGAGGWFVYDRYVKVEVPPIEYQTQPAERGRVTSTVTASGTLSPVKTVEVGSQVSGRIIELMADFNSQVKKGDVIARIDASLLESDKARSKANLMSAKASLTRAVADRNNSKVMLERSRKLASSGVASEQEVDTALLAYTTAKANVETAQAAVSVAQAAIETAAVNLEYTTIVSPIDGVVISRDVSVGQTVAASLSAPKLFLIAEDLRAMEVHTSVAESDVGALRPEMKVNFTVDAYPNERFRGIVQQIRNASTTTQNVVTYDAVVRVDNDQLKLRPGMTASVTFIVEDRRDTLLVPNTALRFTPSDPQIAALAPPPPAGEGRGGRRRGGPDDEAKPEDAKAEDAKPGDTKADPKSGDTKSGDTKSEDAKSEDAKPADGVPAEGKPEGRRGRGGGGGRGAPSTTRTVWVLADGQPRPATIKIGITDGSSTEVTEGELTEGALVILGQSGGVEATRAAGPTKSPLTGGGGGQRGGGGGGGRKGGF